MDLNWSVLAIIEMAIIILRLLRLQLESPPGTQLIIQTPIIALILTYQWRSELREIVGDASRKLAEFGERVKSLVEGAYADFSDEYKKFKTEEME